MTPSVALVDVAPILAVGLHDVLRRAAIKVVDDPDRADAVVLDLDRSRARRHLSVLREGGNPPLVLCCRSGSTDLLVVEVGVGVRVISPCTPTALRSAVRRAPRRGVH